MLLQLPNWFYARLLTEEMLSKPQDEAVPEVSPQSVNEAVGRVVNSDLFAKSERLKAFLIYIVEQALDGRSDEIRGKTIAEDVYGRTPRGESDNVVRVDARRLRRRLVEYYATEGRDDELRIHIDSGGYVPRFELVTPDTDEDPAAKSEPHPNRWRWVAAGVLGAILTGSTVYAAVNWRVEAVRDSTEQRRVQERLALRQKSTKTLQAANLIDEARGMLFPVADAKRQRLATSIFRDAIRIDPTYGGGYAGAAHSLSTLAIMSPDRRKRDKLLAEAKRMSDHALDLAPTEAWTQSAAAWVAFAHKEYQAALDFSARAEKLDPIDGSVLDFRGLITLLTGDFQGALAVADPARKRRTASTRFAYRNIYGAASFHVGNYRTAIQSFHEAARLGDPVSELSLLYSAVANQGAQNFEKAAQLVREMRETWPKFRPDLSLRAFYKHSKDVDQVLAMLNAAGWRQP